jgi:DNA-binding transcriptional LysR family regulator
VAVDFESIRAFAVVAELGSFQDAARVLNISAPALTRRIQKLEAGVRVALLKRTTRRVEVTVPGRQFLPKARKLLDDFDASLSSIKDPSERRSGRIVVACIPTAAYHFLPQAIARFNEQFPRVRVRILEEDAGLVAHRVSQQEADLGITLPGGHDADFDCYDIHEERYVLACRHDHPLAGHDQIAWRDLAPYRLVTANRLSGNRLVIDKALQKYGLQPNWFYEVQHLPTSLGLVAAGLAVVALPELVLPTVAHPLLVSRKLVKPQIKRTIRVIKRREPQLSDVASVFFGLIRNIGRTSTLRAIKKGASSKSAAEAPL